MNSPLVTIGAVSINQDSDGRYNLNDLHQASGGEKRHSPNYWIDVQQTKDLIAELDKPLNVGDTGIPVSPKIKNMAPVVTIRGGKGKQGTYVVRELVYSYAMWISPAFHLMVIRTFDAVMTGQVAPAVPQPIPATIDFEGTTLRVIERDGAPWLAASTLAAALGEGLHLVQNTFHRNRGQFAGMSAVIRDGRTPQVRIFSVWGVYLLCLLIHTPRASRLREWTRTVLDTLGALGGSRMDRPTPAPTLLPSPVDSLTTPAVRAAINRKAHALSLAAFEHNREILEAWLCRCGDLTDPATAIERIHTLELDHGKHAIVDIQLLCEVTRLTGVLERTVAQQQQAIARLSAVTGRQFQ